MSKIIGIDLGSQKTMLVADDADIVLTQTGGTSVPTLVTFFGSTRLTGEEASSMSASDYTLPMINKLLGQSLEMVQNTPLSSHRKTILKELSSILSVEMDYCDEKEDFSIEALLGMFLAKLYERITELYGPETLLSFSCPPIATETEALSEPNPKFVSSLRDGCLIAGIDLKKVAIKDCFDCLIATYTRKVCGLREAEKESLLGKKAVIIDMGHTSSSVVILDLVSLEEPKKIGCAYSDYLGTSFFDLKVFEHFAKICETKHNTKIEPGTKRGTRLITACERIRKLLSQLPESKVVVENLTDNGDVSFSLTRSEMISSCSNELQKFKELLLQAIAQSGVDISEIDNVEILGGGVRMPIIQAAILEVFSSCKVLGGKFDDSTVALGASLLAMKDDSTVGLGLSSTSIVGILTDDMCTKARAREIEMKSKDNEIVLKLAVRNQLESYLLEMRSAPRGKHGQLIDATALNNILDECEGWIWDNEAASLDQLAEKEKKLRKEVTDLIRNYLDTIDIEKKKIEEELNAQAVKANEDRSANGDEDDHDNRKLRKPERMRMVIKNKDEGTELFKGGNMKPAAARYHKALTHCTKFFDLNAEDEKEVNAVKLSLYLNLASVYIKLGFWDQVYNNCQDALKIDPKSHKAIYRRSIYYEGKKEWEKAMVDLKLCQEMMLDNDPAVSKAVTRVKVQLKKQADQEKKTWGKGFGK